MFISHQVLSYGRIDINYGKYGIMVMYVFLLWYRFIHNSDNMRTRDWRDGHIIGKLLPPSKYVPFLEGTVIWGLFVIVIYLLYQCIAALSGSYLYV